MGERVDVDVDGRGIVCAIDLLGAPHLAHVSCSSQPIDYTKCLLSKKLALFPSQYQCGRRSFIR